MHSYIPSSFLRSSGDCKNSPLAGGLSFLRNGSMDLYCLLRVSDDDGEEKQGKRGP